MQFKSLAVSSVLASAGTLVSAEENPSSWTSLSATATYKCGATDYASTFGIGVVPLATSSASAAAPPAKRSVISQIGDGQIQATYEPAAPAPTPSTTTLSSVGSSASSCAPLASVSAVACKQDGTLQITLKDGVLYDSHGRIGSIVANRQFQFDGPPPQAGTIFAKGWSLTPEGNLALGDSDVFYRCLSGNFYNLYDEHIAEQCSAIKLQAIDLAQC
ncbi:uncharacterized protein Ecym_5176 [Eremothecium cymbalariae DBVPG|uniref:Cell wall mannoprotein PIR1-like C-terminal domain-containing protein n=1 Tax=Eremothecium cymbalariae (strain CBS 270.75 / DBVPG 7215 / KCTC 17166 / NRRL Y-17582) TaxID=931890 RepID=I6ND07_ERECY|nr:hypothetical protein Ecym_5176 [Eremothecium cymbalariae DBVPG\